MLSLPHARPECLGATLGQEHFAAVVKRSAARRDIDVLVLDFAGVRAANASYVKATLLNLHESGRLFATESSPTTRPKDPWDGGQNLLL